MGSRCPGATVTRPGCPRVQACPQLPLQRLRVLLCFLSWARGTHGLRGCSRGRWWLWGACGSQWLWLPQGQPAAGSMREAGRGGRPEGRTGGMHSWPLVMGGSGAWMGTAAARASEHGRARSPQPPWWRARPRDLEMAAGSSRPAWPCLGPPTLLLAVRRPPPSPPAGACLLPCVSSGAGPLGRCPADPRLRLAEAEAHARTAVGLELVL